MSFLTRFSLKNTSAVLILCLLIAFGGIYSTNTLKKETMPNINIPIVAVVTIYPGASPGDVEEKITKPLENLISGVNGLKTVTATSSENFSTIVAQFDYSADMVEMERKVGDAIKGAKLPDNVDAPKTMRIDFNAMPVLNFSISNDKLSPEELEQKVKETIIPSLAGIEGVGQVQLASENEKAVFVKLIPSKLKEYNLTSQTVSQMLQANNVSFPAGSLSINNTVEPIKVIGKFNSLDELKNMQLPVIPNTQDMMKSTFSQMGQGVADLGKAVGQMGQGMADLGKAVGQMGQGMAGMNQAFNAQMKLVTAIQETQSKLVAMKFSLDEANQILKDPASNEAEKLKAQATVMQSSEGIKTTEAALNQMNGQLKAIQDRMSKEAANAPITGKTSASSTSASGTTMPASQQASLSPSSNGGPAIALKQVTLGEIAEITVGTDKVTSYSRTDGNPSVVLQVVKTQDANTIDVSDGVKQKLEDMKGILPEGTKTTVILDQADYVKESINGMLKEGIVGAIFAFLVILLFLRNFRTTIIACVSIPLSVLITLVFLKQLDITLNILTLGGLSVAVGRIVDDSIVVIENVYRRLQSEDVRTVDIIKIGTKEVASAITSSTLTTVAVFLPVAMVSGMAGVMFKPFAATVALSLLSSLLVAVTVIPVLSKLLLLKSKSVKHSEFHEGPLMKKYEGLLTWSLNHKLLTLAIAVILLVGSLSLIPFIGTSFVAEQEEKYVSISLNYPAGTDIKVLNEKAIELEKILASDKDVISYQTTIGSNPNNMMAAMGNQGSGRIMVHLNEKSEVDEVIKRFKGKMVPGNEKAALSIAKSNPSDGGMGGVNNMELQINGNDFAKIKEAAKLLTKELSSVKGLEDVSNNLTESKPEIAISVDQKKAGAKTLSAAQVGMTMRELLNDNKITTLAVDKKTLDVRLGLKLEDINKLEDIKALELTSPTGETVKISDIAEVNELPGPVSIYTADGKEYAVVKGTITDKDTGAVNARIQKKLKEITLPDGVETKMGGVAEMMGDTFSQLGIAMIIAVFLVFFVMVIALGEMMAPIAILFSLPLAAIGGLVALFIARIPIDMPSMIGALMLIGIVVTNAIVLIDRVQQNRKEGMSVRECLMEAGRVRMRPILMTAIATIAALVPLAAGISKGSVMSQSLAVIVIGGLATSTLLTLIIVPVAYEMLQNLKNRVLGKSESEPV